MARVSSQKHRISIGSKHKRTGSHSRSELIWGIHPVTEALRFRPRAIREIFIHKDKPGHRLEQIIILAQSNGIPVRISSGRTGTDSDKPDQPSEQERSQGVSARIVLPMLKLDDLLVKLKDSVNPPLLLALDSIQDPHNLGAIIRSAVAAGANAIILPKDRSVPVTGAVMKVSAGSVFHIDICRVTNLVNCLKMLKENGIWIFGATNAGDQLVYDTDLTVPACLVIGSEGKGLRPLVAEQCDLHIAIPMQSDLDSLNAAVAAGIILFETVRQRMTPSV